MARNDARLIRFGVLALALILTVLVLSKGSTTNYVASSNNTSSSSPAAGRNVKSAAKGASTGAGNYKGYSTIPGYEDTHLKKQENKGTVKATFVSLARNRDLWSLIGSIRHVEDRFNSRYAYDWVFLNDEEFSNEFKRTTTALISGQTKYGLIPKEHWSFPEWIDTDKAAATREQMKADKIIYGDSVSYRHMCRYESGFFYRHELLQDYEYYWRVEPDIKIHCDVKYDVFQFMKDNNKQYGFTISIHEYPATIATLWDTTKEFIKEHPEYLPKDNMMDFVSDDGGASYNMCHFWSNFEIGNLNFWRGEAYSKYFEHLDKAGGFFYERWGDAPIHSIAAALFLPKDQIHYFPDIGYYHGPFHNCPINDEFRLEHTCMCNPKDDFTFKGYSCGEKFHTVQKLTKPENWEDFA
jgi:alpha 1,2-mannosyltransferase